MPSDLSPTAETELIKAYVKELAPSMYEISCGTMVNGAGYELWLQLNPNSRTIPVVITQEEFESDVWQVKLRQAIDRLNV
jgi:hypothetical protein